MLAKRVIIASCYAGFNRLRSSGAGTMFYLSLYLGECIKIASLLTAGIHLTRAECCTGIPSQSRIHSAYQFTCLGKVLKGHVLPVCTCKSQQERGILTTLLRAPGGVRISEKSWWLKIIHLNDSAKALCGARHCSKLLSCGSPLVKHRTVTAYATYEDIGTERQSYLPNRWALCEYCEYSPCLSPLKRGRANPFFLCVPTDPLLRPGPHCFVLWQEIHVGLVGQTQLEDWDCVFLGHLSASPLRVTGLQELLNKCPLRMRAVSFQNYHFWGIPWSSGRQPFRHQRLVLWKKIFPWTGVGLGEGWFQDDLNTLHLLCTLFLLLLHCDI